MSTDLDDRVAELLSTVREDLESATIPDEVTGDSLEEVGEQFELAEHAANAREIVETNEPEAILDAVGLAELPDGSEPSSIPAAIARGSEERVRELRALVTLASLAERGEDEDGDELGGALSDLRETLGVDETGEADSDSDEAADVDEASDAAEAATGDEADDEGPETSSEEAGDETEPSTGGEEGDEGVAGDAAEDEVSEEAEDDSTVQDALKAAAGTTVEEFSADLEGLRGRLEALTGDDEAADEGADDTTADEAEPADEADESEPADETDEADDGRFDLGDGQGDGSMGGSSTHSTMPPPPSKRADMRAVRRHSTMPDRH